VRHLEFDRLSSPNVHYYNYYRKKEISVAKQQTEVDHTLPGETGLKRYETDTHGKTFDGEEWK